MCPLCLVSAQNRRERGSRLVDANRNEAARLFQVALVAENTLLIVVCAGLRLARLSRLRQTRI